MKITRLQITIEPWHNRDSTKEFRLEAIIDGISHIVSTPFEEDDFESRFDFMLERARCEILRRIRIQRQLKRLTNAANE